MTPEERAEKIDIVVMSKDAAIKAIADAIREAEQAERDKHVELLAELRGDIAKARREALDEACKAVCGRCRYGVKMFNATQHVPETAGCEHMKACTAYPIRRLMERGSNNDKSE